MLADTSVTYAPVKLDTSLGRLFRNDAMQSQQLALEMKRRREQLLARIQTVLDRIEQGTYGLCGRCRQPIASERLEAQPDVVLNSTLASTDARSVGGSAVRDKPPA